MTPSSDTYQTDRLLRYLGDEMPPDERQALEQSLAADAALRSRLDEVRVLQQAMQSADRRFDDGFVTRVMGRVRDAAPVIAFDQALRIAFLRIAMVVLLLIGGIGSYNITRFDEATGSAVEAALALPDATLSAAAYDTLIPDGDGTTGRPTLD